MLLQELLLDLVAGIYEVTHVDLVKSSQQRVSILRFLEATGNRLTHLAHLNADLSPRATNFLGRSFGLHGLARRLGYLLWCGLRLGFRRFSLNRLRLFDGLGLCSGFRLLSGLLLYNLIFG
jgi:hypothetical protein